MSNVVPMKMINDKLSIDREGKGYVLSRSISETLSEKEIHKRIDEIEAEKKRLMNEANKAKQFIEQSEAGVAECDAKIKALNDALKTGHGEM